MMRSRSLILIAFGGILLVTVALSQTGKMPVNWNGLPDPFHTPSASNRPEVVDRPDGTPPLEVPSGFKVEEYMTGFDERPRFMLLGPSNEILITDSGARDAASGSVSVLKNKTKKKILENLDRPFGMALHEDWLYVAETTSVKRYKYDKQAMTVAMPGEEVVPLHDYGKGHWTRSILFDRDHKKLYVTVGSGSNVDLNEPPARAALHRYNPDGSGHEMVASGLRNTIGLRWRPGSDDLWAAVQERDGLGDDLVSDYLAQIKDGGFYGWPYAYSGPHEEPRHKGAAPDMVKKTLYPDVLLGAHVAVLDILFYTGDQFPSKYKEGLFLAFHGSWNRSKRVGYQIAFIPFKDGKPTSGPQDFLTGWRISPDDRRVWGRPVGLLQMPDGSLLVSDDGGKKLWRISHEG